MVGRQVEKILDRCLEKVKEGVPLDEVLMEYPEHREELKELLTIAKDIESVPLPPVRDEAVASCITKVHKAIQLRKRGAWRARLPRLWWPRLVCVPSPMWAKALAFVLIGIFISWGTVNLSADSLPGDILYPIKLTTEKAKFFLTIDPVEKAELRLNHSEERMEELVKYLDKKGELNTQVLKAMLNEAALVMEDIPKLPKDEGAAYCLKLEHHCAYQKDVLESLKLKVTSPQKEELERAIRICHHRMDWMGKVRRNEVPMGERGPFTLNGS